ncbi:hypothetical protein DL89DRAFT_254529 [Linderina pennispora]|uniref:Methyltransferase type 11 domain-containing protein n=1 Tax=Linderina pennispora TaxID=61395 RepID=A0A1Y1WMN8_9FUNG|nr:uncharacterized protein DL89DRAFT_254529 [Linderina pennispora]ORX74742.1 hypothetical protein DL89DRAFT_254529 [Linderina pennispora]
MYILSSLGSAWSSTYDWAFSKIWLGESTRNDIKADPYRRQIWPDYPWQGSGDRAWLRLLAQAPTAPHRHFRPAAYRPQANHLLHGARAQPVPLQGPSRPTPRNVGSPWSYDRGGVPFNIVRGTLDDENEIPKFIRDEAPYDSIVTSFALCTVGCPQTTLDNIFSLLKPGGTYYFIEHVRQTDKADRTVKVGMDMNARAWAIVQDWITPVWAVVGPWVPAQSADRLSRSLP